MPAAGRGRTVTGVDKPWRDAIRVAVNREVGEGKEKLKMLTVLASKLVRRAAEGDIGAMREIGDRLDGKADANINLGASDVFLQALKELNASRGGTIIDMDAVVDQVGDERGPGEPALLRDGTAESST